MYGGGFDGLKNFLPKQLLESNCRGWVSDVEVRILEYLSNFRFVEPKMLVQGGFCRNGKVAYVYVKRLVVRGLLRKVGRGLYEIVKEKVSKVLHLPVRKLSRRSVVRKSEGTSPGLGGFGLGSGSPSGLGSGFGRCCFRGVFFDNVFGWCGGGFVRLCGVSLGGLGGFDCVSGFEVRYVVGGVFLDGLVRIYTNVFKDGLNSVAVEYVPPSGFVRRNGVASSLRFSRYELVKAFIALGKVLSEILPRKDFSRLLEVLGRFAR